MYDVIIIGSGPAGYTAAIYTLPCIPQDYPFYRNTNRRTTYNNDSRLIIFRDFPKASWALS